MAILPILTEPHPVLAKRARAVTEDEFNADLEAFVSNMAETMYAAPGVGLAAPQVGDSRRILVANLKGDIDEDDRDDHGKRIVEHSVFPCCQLSCLARRFSICWARSSRPRPSVMIRSSYTIPAMTRYFGRPNL